MWRQACYFISFGEGLKPWINRRKFVTMRANLSSSFCYLKVFKLWTFFYFLAKKLGWIYKKQATKSPIAFKKATIIITRDVYLGRGIISYFYFMFISVAATKRCYDSSSICSLSEKMSAMFVYFKPRGSFGENL